MAKYYVEQKYYDGGKTTAKILTSEEAKQLGYYNGYTDEGNACDTYVNAFCTLIEARQCVRDTLNAQKGESETGVAQMSNSIMQTKKRCYKTGRTDNLHKHHIYFGNPSRKLSERYGCWVWLTGEYHTQSCRGVHFDIVLDTKLKQRCQRKFEEIYSHEFFMQVFGRNYL